MTFEKNEYSIFVLFSRVNPFSTQNQFSGVWNFSRILNNIMKLFTVPIDPSASVIVPFDEVIDHINEKSFTVLIKLLTILMKSLPIPEMLLH